MGIIIGDVEIQSETFNRRIRQEEYRPPRFKAPGHLTAEIAQLGEELTDRYAKLKSLWGLDKEVFYRTEITPRKERRREAYAEIDTARREHQVRVEEQRAAHNPTEAALDALVARDEVRQQAQTRRARRGPIMRKGKTQARREKLIATLTQRLGRAPSPEEVKAAQDPRARKRAKAERDRKLRNDAKGKAGQKK